MTELYGVIWIRGIIKAKPRVRKTLESLGLDKKNSLAIIPEDRKKMLKIIEGFVTYGEINKETLTKIIKKKLKIENPEKKAEKILKGEEKVVFHLRPPSKGFERGGIKKFYKEGGAIGYRGSDINQLLGRMI